MHQTTGSTLRLASSSHFLSLAALLLGVALAACGGGDDDDAAGPDAGGDPPGAAPVIVDCAGVSPAATITAPAVYSPEQASIAAGAVVAFDMPSSHNAVSGSPGSPDGKFTADFGTKTCIRFDEPGDYPFFCGPHRFTGVIVVE